MRILYISGMLTRGQLNRLKSSPLGTGGNRLSNAMSMAGVTQVQLAEHTGLTQSYLSRILNGRAPRLPIETAQRVALVFGCKADDLFPYRHEERISA